MNCCCFPAAVSGYIDLRQDYKHFHSAEQTGATPGGSSVDDDVALNLGLARQNVPLFFVVVGQSVLYGHADATRDESRPAGSARSRAARILDRYAEFLGN